MKIVEQLISKDEQKWFDKMDNILNKCDNINEYSEGIYNIAINQIYCDLNSAVLDENIECDEIDYYIDDVVKDFIGKNLKLSIDTYKYIINYISEETDQDEKINVEEITDYIYDNIDDLDMVKEEIIEEIYSEVNIVKEYIYDYISDIMENDDYKIYLFLTSSVKDKSELNLYEEKCYSMYKNPFEGQVGICLQWISNRFSY
ncbi:hypothetical protein [Paraclostridium sordellii]|uniref:hypothetical protein n=1 Tax=Paraclostridium sordellii TaxID=1505 RepID=UPI000C76616B|nr:hypothetical protein [Paeniclostridium sordellii]AUN14323.1 hypothetical protein RSJ16_08860 [Paeniclostridium sordellii]